MTATALGRTNAESAAYNAQTAGAGIARRTKTTTMKVVATTVLNGTEGNLKRKNLKNRKQKMASRKGECPFCGSLSSSITDKWDSANGYWRKRVAYVRCCSCNARGPAIKTDRDYDVRNERIDRLERNALHADAWAARFGQFPKPKNGKVKQMELEV